MCLNEDAAISSINSNCLKWVDKFIQISSNISSTESNVNIYKGKAWTAIKRLTTPRKFWWIKMIFLLRCSCVSTIEWLYCFNFNKAARWELLKDSACYFKQILEATPNKTAAVQPLTSHLTNHPSNTSKICCDC